jgi:hypothetical protein
MKIKIAGHSSRYWYMGSRYMLHSGEAEKRLQSCRDEPPRYHPLRAGVDRSLLQHQVVVPCV